MTVAGTPGPAAAANDHALVVVDTSGAVAQWNDAARRLMGHAAADVVGRPLHVLLAGDAAPAELAAAHFGRAEAEAEARHQGWVRRADGTSFAASFVTTALRDAGGGVTGFGVVVRDLTERRMAEIRSRHSEAIFRALSENMREFAIFLLDTNGIITYWGEGARLMKSWTREQAEGSHLRMLYPPGGSDDGTAEAHIAEAAVAGEYTGEGRRLRADGSTFWAGVTLTALRDVDGMLLGFAKVSRDLTAARAAQAVVEAAANAAEAARLAAEEANTAKSQFLATMSHEIRTPINAIVGYTELLEMELAGPLIDAQRAYLERVRASGRHLLGLVDEVLDFSRLEAGRVAVERRARLVGRAVGDAITLVHPQAVARGLELVNSVPELAASTAYWGDEDRVRQILVNLLSNAVKFTAAGGRITVSAGAEHDGVDGSDARVYIRVEDTGSGIAAERLAAIFDAFEQADMTHTRQHGGTGLGLAISRRLARLMGGDLTARSTPGAGSAFSLWLPAAPAGALLGPERDAGGGEVEALPRALLRRASEAVLEQVERILHAYVARLRVDPATPSAHHQSAEEVEDHWATLLADLGSTMSAAALHTAEGPESLRDGAAIQRLVSERHGRQRQRLGWLRAEVEREYEVIGEEVIAAVRRRSAIAEGELEAVLRVVDTFLADARRVSLAAFDSPGEG
jgi:PAS domain S-box-containing protein